MSDLLIPRRLKSSAIFTGLPSLIMLLLFGGSVQAQSRTIHDGYTPAGVEQGAPAGAYPLSGFENINLFNGSLNVALPLVTVGGRGTAGYTMTLQMDKHWELYRFAENLAGEFSVLDEASFQAGRSWRVGYGPGVLIGMNAADKTNAPVNGLPCGPPPLSNVYHVTYLTRLTFVMPDGSEVLLHDRMNQGISDQLNLCTLPQAGLNRGKVFVSADGESMTFISDDEIRDNINLNTSLANEFLPSGYLLMKDGTRYRIINGRVMWIRDRNGNRVSFAYETLTPSTWRLLTVTDSLNRLVSITYAATSTGYDEITLNGFGGEPRSIKVWYSPMQNSLYPEATIKKGNQLFPEIYTSTNGWEGDWDMNPALVSKIELPDQRAYQFLYNSYGEIARIILPTGGGFDYTYAASAYLSGGTYSNLYGLMLYRRVTKRTVYNTLTPTTDPDSPPAGTREKIESYEVETPQTGNITVRVEVRDGADVLTAQSKHYFYGNPMFSGDESKTPACYSWWASGKEYKTESFNVSGGMAGSVLRKSDQEWFPTVGAGSEAACYGVPAPSPRIAEAVSTLSDTNQVARQTFAYDEYNNIKDVYEYDFGSGTPSAQLIRHTHTDYKTDGYDTIMGGTGNPDPIATIHIRNLPELQTVEDANGVIRAKTTYEYDGSLLEAPENYGGIAIPGLVSRGGLTQAQGYNPASDLPRGNVTRVTRWLLANTGLVAQDTGLHTVSRYDVAGNVVKVWDAKGYETTFDYSDSFSGDFTPNTFAFLKSSTSPTPSTGFGGGQALVSTSVYDFQSGKVVLTRDPNSQETTFEYNDPLDRLTKVVRPSGGGETLYEYGFGDTVATRFIHTQTKQNSSAWIEDYGFYDGLGRTWRAAHVEGADYFSVRDSQFDALGRANKVSNPYFFNGTFNQLVASEASNTNLTITTFDALGRATRVTTPDGSHVDTEYAGNKVTVKDQKERARSSITDGLGRLVQVNEDPSVTPGDTHLNYQTNYTYDVLGNLIRVRQGGFPTGGSLDPTVQFRRFYYDSLSRLVYANNPEQEATIPFNPPNESGTKWTMKYVYDANGNLTSRTEARIVPASLLNVTTTYGYDALNRNTTVDYNDGTAAIRRYYDVSTNGDGGATPFTNGKGRLRRVESLNIYPGTTQHAYSRTVLDGYDALGRITSQKQGFGNNADSYADYPVSRAYDLASHTIFQSYPSTNTVGYLYGADGRLTNFNGYLGNQNGDAFAKEMSYNAAGQMLREKLVTQSTLYHHTKYNNRFQMVEVSVGTNSDGSSNADDVWNRGRLQFFYNSSAVAGGNPAQDGTDNNGNVLRQKHLVPLTSGGYAIPMQDDYFYDPINRLTQVKGYQQSQGGSQGGSTFAQIYQQTYSYDKFGNRKLYLNASDPSGTTWGNQINGTSPSHIWEPDKKTNRLMAVTYDAAGNMIKDIYSARTDTKVYDAENRMTKSVGGGNTNSYVYDGDGRRVRRIVGGSGTNSGDYWQVYGIDGELLAEYKLVSGSPVLQKEYGYRAGQLLVIGEPQIGITPAEVKWLVSDHLGTPRIIADSTGSLSNVRRHDYLPFGEELTVGIGGTQSTPAIRSTAMGYIADFVRQKFGSKERDAETGLDYFLARYYSSVQGRFTSPDELLADQREDDPQSWNLYSYVRNSPLVFIDPFGRNKQAPQCLSNGGCYNPKTDRYEIEGENPKFVNATVRPDIDTEINEMALRRLAHQREQQRRMRDAMRRGDVIGPGLAPVGVGGAAIRTASRGRLLRIINKIPVRKNASQILEAEMTLGGQIKPPGHAAHHIVAFEAQAAAPARDVLLNYGVGINKAENGVYLLEAVHNPIHTGTYYNAVNDLLILAQSRAEVLAALTFIRDGLLKGTFP